MDAVRKTSWRAILLQWFLPGSAPIWSPGLGLGFANQFAGVQAQINGAIVGLASSASMNVNMSGQVSGAGGAAMQALRPDRST